MLGVAGPLALQYCETGVFHVHFGRLIAREHTFSLYLCSISGENL